MITALGRKRSMFASEPLPHRKHRGQTGPAKELGTTLSCSVTLADPGDQSIALPLAGCVELLDARYKFLALRVQSRLHRRELVGVGAPLVPDRRFEFPDPGEERVALALQPRFELSGLIDESVALPLNGRFEFLDA